MVDISYKQGEIFLQNRKEISDVSLFAPEIVSAVSSFPILFVLHKIKVSSKNVSLFLAETLPLPQVIHQLDLTSHSFLSKSISMKVYNIVVFSCTSPRQLHSDNSSRNLHIEFVSSSSDWLEIRNIHSTYNQIKLNYNSPSLASKWPHQMFDHILAQSTRQIGIRLNILGSYNIMFSHMRIPMVGQGPWVDWSSRMSMGWPSLKSSTSRESVWLATPSQHHVATLTSDVIWGVTSHYNGLTWALEPVWSGVRPRCGRWRLCSHPLRGSWWRGSSPDVRTLAWWYLKIHLLWRRKTVPFGW